MSGASTARLISPDAVRCSEYQCDLEATARKNPKALLASYYSPGVNFNPSTNQDSASKATSD